jgi:hypothetical protein
MGAPASPCGRGDSFVGWRTSRRTYAHSYSHSMHLIAALAAGAVLGVAAVAAVVLFGLKAAAEEGDHAIIGRERYGDEVLSTIY